MLTDYILGDASKNQDSQQQQCSMTPMEIKNIAKAVTKPIGIKQLLMVLEMARSDVEVDADDDSAGPPGSISPEQFLECLHTAGF